MRVSAPHRCPPSVSSRLFPGHRDAQEFEFKYCEQPQNRVNKHRAAGEPQQPGAPDPLRGAALPHTLPFAGHRGLLPTEEGGGRNTGGSSQPSPWARCRAPARPLHGRRSAAGAGCADPRRKGRTGPGPPRRCAPALMTSSAVNLRPEVPAGGQARYPGIRRFIENTRKYKFIAPLQRRKAELAEICFG